MATANGKEGGRHRARTAIVLSGLAGTAFFLAAGSTQLIAAATLDSLLVSGVTDGGPEPVAPISSRRNREPEGTAILQRNIFDSVLGSMEWELPIEVVEPTADTEAPPPEVVDPTGEHPRCEGAVRLVASYVRATAPEQSFAAITNAAGTALLYREGMAVDDRTVLRIERQRVVMQPNAGSLCDLLLFDPGSTGVPRRVPLWLRRPTPPCRSPRATPASPASRRPTSTRTSPRSPTPAGRSPARSWTGCSRTRRRS
jgi:general secretion pathway protein C